MCSLQLRIYITWVIRKNKYDLFVIFLDIEDPCELANALQDCEINVMEKIEKMRPQKWRRKWFIFKFVFFFFSDDTGTGYAKKYTYRELFQKKYPTPSYVCNLY